MATKINGKRVIITGGARGLGFVFSRNLLIKGAKILAIFGSNSTRGIEAVKKLNDEFGSNRAFFLQTDVANANEFADNFKKAVEKMNGLDIVINNAGVLNDLEWSKMIDVNIKGTIQGTLLAIETMGKNNGKNGGLVVNVASSAGIEPSVIYFPGYCATKHAVIAFSRSVADSFDITGVAIKNICPGQTDSDMTRDLSLRYLDFVNYKEIRQIFQTLKLQSPEIVANTLIKLIEETPNDTTWLQTNDAAPLAVIFPDYKTMLFPVQ